ncbi:MAG: hypothetical protein V7638_1281 [Acidobacteriota bacterium]
MVKIGLRLSVYMLVVLLSATRLVCAQGSAVKKEAAILADRQFENVRLEEQSVEILFTSLSLTYDIPIGLEIASNDDNSATYALDLKKGTLTDLLTQFARQHNQYTWEIKDGVVNIFPKHNYRDFVLDELLGTQISKFSLKENSSCWTLVESLTDTLEVRKILQTYGMTRSGLNFSGAYFPQVGTRFKFDVTDMTVRTILNKVIKESPVAKIWLIKRYSGGGTFDIRLNARHENLTTQE